MDKCKKLFSCEQLTHEISLLNHNQINMVEQQFKTGMWLLVQSDS